MHSRVVDIATPAASSAQLSCADLATYFYLGYFVGNGGPLADVRYQSRAPLLATPYETCSASRHATHDARREQLAFVEASSLWDSIIRRLLEASRSRVVVPISGGLDSRFILCGLMRHLPAKSIETYTFGAPGTFDFEIGNQIAHRYGTSHTTIDLSIVENVQAGLSNHRHSYPGTSVHSLPPIELLLRRYPGDTHRIWSGLMGDPLMGSHLPAADLPDYRELLLAKEHSGTPAYTDVLGPASFAKDDVQRTCFGKRPITSPDAAEAWDFENRQRRFVLPQICFRGMEYVTPFLEDDWTRFCLALPNDVRRGSRWYHRFLRHYDPDAFSLPTKNYLGRPIPSGPIGHLAYWARRIDRRLRRRRYVARGVNYYPDLGVVRQTYRKLHLENLEALMSRDGLDVTLLKKKYTNYDTEFAADPAFFGLCSGLRGAL